MDMPKVPIKNILFDFGGVIVDLDRSQAVRQFEAMGFADADKELDTYQQSGLALDLESGTITGDEFCQKLAERIGHPVSREAVAKAWQAFISAVPAYKLAELEKLCKEYRVLILSNTNPFVVDWFLSDKFTPEGRPLSDFAEKIYASCDMGCCKPERAIFEQVLKDAGIRAEETLFVDDGPKNTAIAQILGFQTYCPKNGEDWRADLEAVLSTSKSS